MGFVVKFFSFLRLGLFGSGGFVVRLGGVWVLECWVLEY